MKKKATLRKGKTQIFFLKKLLKTKYCSSIKFTSILFIIMFSYSLTFAQEYTYSKTLSYTNPNIDVGNYSSPEYADLDNDGDLDLYVGNSNGYVNVFINDGNGNLLTTGNLQANGKNINVGQYSVPTFADIDNDGDLDLYVGENDGYINVFINDGNGNFSEAGSLQADGTAIDIGDRSSPDFADLDNDGDLDLYVGRADGKISVFINFGGNFSATGDLQADGSDIDVGNYSSLVFADIDNDGDLDLYIGEESGYITVFINDGNGNFSETGKLQADNSNIRIVIRPSPTFADLDNDGDFDLYIGEDDGIIFVFINDGNGNFTKTRNLQANGATIDIEKYSAPAFADIDNDGDLDLYVGKESGYIAVFINDGNGNYTATGNLQADGTAIDVGRSSVPVFADIDNDGDLDLYIGVEGGYITVFINDGNGNFSEAGNLQADGATIDIGTYSVPKFADLDNDGDLDLYIGEYDGYINVYINDGNGNFSTTGYLQADGATIDIGDRSSPEFADIDNDGDLDLYVGDAGGIINFFLNDGNGNFTLGKNMRTKGANIDVSERAALAFAD